MAMMAILSTHCHEIATDKLVSLGVPKDMVSFMGKTCLNLDSFVDWKLGRFFLFLFFAKFMTKSHMWIL